MPGRWLTGERLRRGAALAVWLLILGLLAPRGAWWQSDDFIALEYSADAARAWSDFAGNQYGLQGVVWFWRPLVTLSFWAEQSIAGGPSPGLSHWVNVILHVGSGAMVASLGTRLRNERFGLLAGLVWLLAPSQTGAVWWAVGRVDGLATCFMLGAALAFLRHLDDGKRAWAWLALAAGALMAKESALALPGALALLGFATGTHETRRRRALAAWPSLVLLPAYFAVRYQALGVVLGGYDDGRFDVLASIAGLGSGLVHALAATAETWLVLAALGLVLLVIAWLRRGRAVLVALAGFVVLAVPSLPLWSQLDQATNQRLLHAALVPIALLVAEAGVIPVILLLLTWFPILDERRTEQTELWQRCHAMHARLATTAAALPQADDTLFVAGLPRASASGRFAGFHLGVDRLLAPPFAKAPWRRVLALRPLDQRPDAIAIPYGDDRGLPVLAPTMRFAPGDALDRLERAELADLTLRIEGGATVATSMLLDLDNKRARIAVRASGVRSAWYRVTLFTASGYLSCLLQDRAEAGDPDGAIDVVDLLRARYVTGAGPDTAHVLFALGVAATFDREPRFPLLIEAGELDPAQGPAAFRATHANRSLVELAFDRGIAEFLAGRPPR
ncbi:MAG: hypothetical protein HZB39_17680 [Planctomycetes bacterium]|nr:hypothetical protein [Planctomycetota bacterium]